MKISEASHSTIASPKDHGCSDIPGAPIARIGGVMDKTGCAKAFFLPVGRPGPGNVYSDGSVIGEE